MGSEPKPCPFCGGNATLYGQNEFWVECDDCQVSNSVYGDAADAVAAWNRRHLVSDIGDSNCVTPADGSCTGGPCMHDPRSTSPGSSPPWEAPGWKKACSICGHDVCSCSDVAAPPTGKEPGSR